MAMLPTVVPAVRRFLSPNVNWVGKRFAFFTISGTLVVAGLLIVFLGRGKEMLDIEFRSGTQVTFDLAEGKTLSIEQVRHRLSAHAEVAEAIQSDNLTQPDQLSGKLRKKYSDMNLDQVFRDMQPVVARFSEAGRTNQLQAAGASGEQSAEGGRSGAGELSPVDGSASHRGDRGQDRGHQSLWLQHLHAHHQ